MCWPTASAAAYPKSTSAPRFHEVMTPSSVLLTMASSEQSTIAASSARSASSCGTAIVAGAALVSMARVQSIILSSSKRRPALVVSAFNDQMQDLVVVAITSHLTDGDAVIIEPTDCVDGVFPRRWSSSWHSYWSTKRERSGRAAEKFPAGPQKRLTLIKSSVSVRSERPSPATNQSLGRLAQLVRARASHARGLRFES